MQPAASASASANQSGGGLGASAASGGSGMTTQTKKQLFMKQRSERLKDPKVRQMGVDRQALDEQVREREALRRLEKDRNDYFDRQALLMDRHACALQQEVNNVRAGRERDVADYRETFQRSELRREWDLNDPRAKAKELPARVGDEDPRNGASSLQRFEGEDLDARARRAAQQLQQHSWAQQQVEEKLAKKWMEQEADRTYYDRNEETNRRTYEVERQIAAQRRLIDCNNADFNRALADQQRREALRDEEEDTRRGLEEIAYQMDSDFLTERETVVNDLGETVKAERYKGMSEEDKARLREGQATQLAQLRRRRLLDVEEEKQWAQQENMQVRMAAALDRQQARERKAELQELAEVHKTQAGASVVKKAELDELYTNAIDEDYYKYWNRCE